MQILCTTGGHKAKYGPKRKRRECLFPQEWNGYMNAERVEWTG
jgi:hypothetical protein